MLASELGELSDEELVAKLDEAKHELFTLRFQRESGQLENVARIRLAKRDVARILTVMRERELAAQEVEGEQ